MYSCFIACGAKCPGVQECFDLVLNKCLEPFYSGPVAGHVQNECNLNVIVALERVAFLVQINYMILRGCIHYLYIWWFY
jgi:hypothetical protein